ncbi:hypothetical protein [Intestinibacter sp.]|uniref:hypothetical protein n=1 Tax=Intestinibacter sp. TaxID=1965304 RepID=UPI003F1554EC
MAAIDKTYVSTWKEYKEIRDWAEVTNVVFPDGTKGAKLIEWFYFPNLGESDFIDSKEYVLWNTDLLTDMFLYANCPFELVQNRLKEQYSDLSELERKPINKHEVGNHFKFPKKILKCTYLINVEREGEHWWYDEHINQWVELSELRRSSCSSCYVKILLEKSYRE